MRISMDAPVSELVSAHSVCALVFDRYQIDYCGEGHLTLLAACDKRRLDPGRLVYSCNAAVRFREPRAQVDPSTLSTKQLIATVIAQHHRYVYGTLPMLIPLAERVAIRHGETHPFLREVALRLDALATRLLEHISDEEQNVLPACERGEASRVRDLLAGQRAEHRQVVETLHALRDVCHGYVANAAICSEHRALLGELKHLDEETRAHLAVEDDELFRRFRT